MYEYGTLNSVKVILRRGRGNRKNNGGMNQPRYNICIDGYVTTKLPV
jgi:hypothetical protein